MIVIPAIDLEAGRSRVVYWPGAASGEGAPTDRPEVIAERFVELGARMVHVVDLDGARRGQPAGLETVGRIATRVGVALQLAGGLESAEAIRLAFAAGATRAVVGMSLVDDPDRLRACVDAAGDWLAVGIDPRPERFAAYPWRRAHPPTVADAVAELASNGVRRVLLSHGGAAPDPAFMTHLVHDLDVEVLVAGGVADLAGIRRLKDAGVSGVILGETLLTGQIAFSDALEAAA